MIIMFPENGLCNRMMAVASGYALAKELSQEYRVIWNRDRFLGATFNDLFCPIADIPVTELCWEHSLADKLRYPYFWFTRHPLAGKLPEWIRSMIFDRVLKSPELHAMLMAGRSIADELRATRKSLLFSYENFHSGGVSSLRCFQPVPNLKDIVDREAQRFGPNVIGVHIRKPDHDTVIWKNSLEEFEACMSREVESEESATFFLATDSAESEKHIRNRFGSRVMAREKSRNRENVAGMRDAVIDLYLLSRTRKVLGSSGSTFSTAAAALGGIPLVSEGRTGCP